MDDRRDLGYEGSGCLLSVEKAAALLRVGVGDLAVELGRGTLPTVLLDGIPHLDGDALWRELNPQAEHMPRHLIDTGWEPPARATTVGACSMPAKETRSTGPTSSPERFSPG
jgi:hypothetical protein